MPYRNKRLGNALQLIALACAGYGLFCFFHGVYSFAYKAPSPYGTQWIVWFPLSYGLFVLGKSMSLETVDPSKFSKSILLYLRSFGNDSIINNHEILINRYFHSNIDKYTIGRPQEILSPLGFNRIYLDLNGDEWKNDVSRIITRASLILFFYNQSEGAKWELGKLVEQNALSKLLLFFPGGNENSIKIFSALRDELALNYAIELPSIEKKNFKHPQIVTFDKTGRPLILQHNNKYLEIIDKVTLFKFSNATHLVLYLKLKPLLLQIEAGQSPDLAFLILREILLLIIENAVFYILVLSSVILLVIKLFS